MSENTSTSEQVEVINKDGKATVRLDGEDGQVYYDANDQE